MNENDKEKIWAYVDGEMPQAERAAFEHATMADPDLAREVEAVRHLDQSLSRLLPMSEQKDDVLETRILDAWEASQESAPRSSRAAPEPEIRRPDFRVLWTRFLPPALALAACVIFGLGISARIAGPLRWIETGGVAVIRGPGGSPYPEEVLRDLRGTVQSALKAEYRRQAPASESSLLWGLKSPWFWDVRVASTADGALLVQMAIRGKRDGATAQEWTQLFAGPDELNAKINDWAKAVVEESRAAR